MKDHRSSTKKHEIFPASTKCLSNINKYPTKQVGYISITVCYSMKINSCERDRGLIIIVYGVNIECVNAQLDTA